MNISDIKKKITEGQLDRQFTDLLSVPSERISDERHRYCNAADRFSDMYGNADDVRLFSVGGRSEISGNHTDHNHGRVIAAAVNLDILAVAAPTDDGEIRIKSEGFPEDRVPASAADAPSEDMYFTSAAIIAGMERAFLDAGYRVGGFCAYTTSNVLKGSGISSSAAFEVMVGNILSHLYNDGRVSNVEIAKMAQFAENRYFGKPCGLMDQTACAVGGFITIDFRDPTEPEIEALDFDLKAAGYSLCLVNTGGNHADLNDDYASVPAEMKSVAKLMGQDVLRGLTVGDLVANAPRIRRECGDRALLRAMHFITENDRVGEQVDALKRSDTDSFFRGVTDSGNSSFKYLQNVYTVKNVAEQGLSVALCITEHYLKNKRGACRVHGGGFAGTIQAFIPSELASEYKSLIDSVFGEGACHILFVRRAGAVELTLK